MSTKYEQLWAVRANDDWLVWRARDTASNERFLLKQVQHTSDNRDYLGRQLAEEYEFLRKLDHPGLLAVRDYDPATNLARFEDTQASLAQLVAQEGPLEGDLVANVLHQCGKALAYLHGKKLAHGSIGTQTILLAPNGTVKFGDFLGCRLDRNAAPRRPDERVRYLAPEMLSSTLGSFTPSSELYCLGYVALQMLLGDKFERLFTVEGLGRAGVSDNLLSWHANLKTSLPNLRERLHCQTALIDIIATLTQKDPALRLFRSAEELVAKIEELGLTSARTLPRVPRDRKEPGKAKPRLQVNVGRGRSTQQVAFDPGTSIIVGRQTNCDLVLDDESVAHKHALLVCLGETWWVFDLKSKDGTTVNGRPILAGKHLKSGDTVGFGRVVGTVETVAASPDSVPPKLLQINNIRLMRRLHEGEHGELYLGQIRFKQGPRAVAVRLFPARFSVQEAAVSRLARGALEAAEFRHPNIVRIYRLGRVPKARNRWYLAMEYLAGGSLRDRLSREGPLPMPDALRMARDILAALQEIEKQNSLHRNITPSCILFNEAGDAKLSDFLLMRGEELETAMEITRGAGTPVGDNVYQPPELLLKGQASKASDLYMLAACLYEALLGRPPFPATLSLPEILKAVETAPVRPPREVIGSLPVHVEAALLRALAKRPQDRFPTATAFLEALQG